MLGLASLVADRPVPQANHLTDAAMTPPLISLRTTEASYIWSRHSPRCGEFRIVFETAPGIAAIEGCYSLSDVPTVPHVNSDVTHLSKGSLDEYLYS
jgi:hypothetical protein